MTVVSIAFVVAVVNLIVADLAGWFPWLAERMIRRAVLLLPACEQGRYEDEWLAELDALPGRGISAIIFAFRLSIHAPAVGRETIGSRLARARVSQTKVWPSQVETVFRLAHSAESRDKHHLHRVSVFSETLARKAGLSAPRRELVRLASQLHDVGKIAVPDSVLQKPGPLTAEEAALVKGWRARTQRWCNWVR